jgi:hypothetical protein
MIAGCPDRNGSGEMSGSPQLSFGIVWLEDAVLNDSGHWFKQ